MKIHEISSQIRLNQNERHLLVGLNGWVIVPNIWQHTEIKNSSYENNIIRVQDNFGI
jgi:mannose-6-phosphate isomerase